MPRPSNKTKTGIAVGDFTTSEIVSLVQRASELLDLWEQRHMPHTLAGGLYFPIAHRMRQYSIRDKVGSNGWCSNNLVAAVRATDPS